MTTFPYSLDPLGAVLRRDPGPFRDAAAAPGEPVFHVGEPVVRLIYVVEGLLALLSSTALGEEQITSVRAEGSLLGHEAMLGMSAVVEVRALTSARLLVAPARAFRVWCDEHRDVACAATEAVAVAAAQGALERRLLLGAALHRVARFLVERETQPLMRAWRRAPMHAVAGLLLMRPETLSRSIRALQERGLVADGRSLEVRDLAGLTALLGEAPAS